MKRILPLILLFLFSASVICGQKIFENKKFGFSMREPKNWTAVTREEVKENLESFEITDEILAEMAKRSKGVIFLTAYTKYEPDEKEGLIPKIQVDVLPHTTKNFEQFKTAITNNSKNYKKYFEDFEFIQEPQEVLISGIKSVFLIGKFSLKMVDGQQLRARTRVYSIPYKNYFFQVSMTDGQVEEDNAKLFDELAKTIKIGN